jgi:hypothetical protein
MQPDGALPAPSFRESASVAVVLLVKTRSTSCSSAERSEVGVARVILFANAIAAHRRGRRRADEVVARGRVECQSWSRVDEFGTVVEGKSRGRGDRFEAPPNSAIEADEALGRYAPSGLRSLMPSVSHTHFPWRAWLMPSAKRPHPMSGLVSDAVRNHLRRCAPWGYRSSSEPLAGLPASREHWPWTPSE